MFRPISPDLEDPTLIHRERAEKLAKLQQLAAKKASRESLNQEPSSSAKVSLQKPTPIKPEPVKAKKPERKLQRKVSADSDSSLDLPLNQKILPRASAVLAPKVAPAPAASSAATPSPAPEDDGGSIFLKSLSALRDNCLSPAESESNIKEGRLLGALGISENASDCDDSTDVEDAKSTASSGKRVRFRISSEDDESDEHEDELGDLS